MESFSQEYVLPWVINIALAVAIFVVGRLIVKLLMKVIGRLLRRSKMDEMLVTFVSTMQDSLKNFAAGVMLIIFRPFKTGDFVEAGGVSGIVEKITIFNSIFRSGDNREIIIPNGKIYSDNIINYSARDTRRVDMVFGIGYGDDLLKAKQVLCDILDQDERVLKDPAPVVSVAELADSSVNFNVRPWVKSEDYWAVLWDTTEKVKLEFDRQGISIPFPQMDLHLHQEGADQA